MAKEYAARLLSIGYGRTRSGFIASIVRKTVCRRQTRPDGANFPGNNPHQPATTLMWPNRASKQRINEVSKI